jgi:hypothetical protein
MIIRVANVNGQQEFRVYEHGQIIARFETLSRAQAYVDQVEAAELFKTLFKIYQHDLCNHNRTLHNQCKAKFIALNK